MNLLQPELKNWRKSMMDKIAVFTRSTQDFNDLRLLPKDMFIHIIDVNDIRGRTFIGVVETYQWWGRSEDIRLAHHLLEERFPNIFKNKNHDNNSTSSTSGTTEG